MELKLFTFLSWTVISANKVISEEEEVSNFLLASFYLVLEVKYTEAKPSKYEVKVPHVGAKQLAGLTIHNYFTVAKFYLGGE